jgi:hypothetical protein
MGWAWVRALGCPFFRSASGWVIHSDNVTATGSCPAAVADCEIAILVLPYGPAALRSAASR